METKNIDINNLSAEQLKDAIAHILSTYSLDELSEMFQVPKWDENFSDTLSWGVNTLAQYSIEEFFRLIEEYESFVAVIPGDVIFYLDSDGIRRTGIVTQGPKLDIIGTGYTIAAFNGTNTDYGITKKDILSFEGHSDDFDNMVKSIQIVV